MRSKTDPRHAARELALSSIFCWLFSEQGGDESLGLSKELLDLTEEEHGILDIIVQGVKTNVDEIDKIIEESAPEWPLDKISKVDLVILRIAVFEIVYGKKTPTKVAIDEAVELAKEFGNDTSHKFINGVLGTVAEKYNKQ
jgi:N utilization substance protein B